MSPEEKVVAKRNEVASFIRFTFVSCSSYFTTDSILRPSYPPVVNLATDCLLR